MILFILAMGSYRESMPRILEKDFDSVKLGRVKQQHRKSFLSVAVITCASHAQGRRFEPGRKHYLLAVKIRVLSISVCRKGQADVS